jgi:hypothetical protein
MKTAAQMTIEEFKAELSKIIENVFDIPKVERDKNNRSYLGKQFNRQVSGVFASKQTKIAMQRGNNGYDKGKYDG